MVRTKHKGAWAWQDLPIDWIGLIRARFQPSRGQSGMLQITWPLSCQDKYCSTTRVPSLSFTGHHSRPTGGLVGGVLPLCRVVVSVFYSPSRQGKGFKYCCPTLIVLLNTIKRFQVLVSNTDSFICTQFNGFKYCYVTLVILLNNIFDTLLDGSKYSKWLNSSIWPTDGTLAGTTTSGQSRPRSNVSKGYLSFPRVLGLKPHYQM